MSQKVDESLLYDAVRALGIGPPIDLSTIDDGPLKSLMQGIQDYVIDHCKVRNCPQIHLRFTDSTELNAIVGKHNDLYVIGISTGLTLKLVNLFLYFLSHRSILPQIGECEKESNASTPLHTIAKIESIPLRLPLCPLRYKKAIQLAFCSLFFIANHEVGHIIYGHIDYLWSLPIQLRISEHPRLIKNRNMLLFQTLEMNADAYAINTLMWNFSARNILTANALNHSFKQNILENWFAICTFFRMFGEESLDNVKLDEFDHPPDRARCLMCLETAAAHAIEFWKLDENSLNSFVEYASGGFFDAEKAFVLVEARLETPKGILAGLEWEYRKQLLDFWKMELRAKLEPFAKTILPV